MVDSSIRDTYSLQQCAQWIREHGFKRVAIQLKQAHLQHAIQIVDFLKLNSYPPSENHPPLDLYVSQANTCSVDLLVTQHVSRLDAVVHVGQVCLSAPVLKNGAPQLPVLFVYQRHSAADPHFSHYVNLILSQIRTLLAQEENCQLCVLYESNLIQYAQAIEDRLGEEAEERVDVAHLYCPLSQWNTTPAFQKRYTRHKDDHQFGPFVLKKPISQYTCALHIGHKLSITLALECPPNLVKLALCPDGTLKVDKPSTSKLLNKRIALVSRLKEERELKFGVIITNPLADLAETIARLRTYSRRRNHSLYFISMIQTVDECKIGNFDLCDAFVVANACTCSTIVESLVFNRPILSELEFKLACDWEAEYGRVMWPSSSSHLLEESAEDVVNRRKASDVSLALIHTRNELLERCSQARANKWSGLDYGHASGGAGESLNIEEGLQGIASSYASEPLKRTNQDKECCGSGNKLSSEALVANKGEAKEQEALAKSGPSTVASGCPSTSTSSLVVGGVGGGGEAELLKVMRINDYDDGNGGGPR